MGTLLTLFLSFLALCGLATLTAGALLYRGQRRLEANGLPVDVEVVEVKETASSFDEYDLSYTPVFEIMSGPHAGKQHATSFSAFPPAHKVGDRATGLYDPETGKIQSMKQVRSGTVTAAIYAIAGVSMIIFSGFIWLRQGGV